MGTTVGRASQRIVVGYDGSADADRGLDWAIEYAHTRAATIEVFASSGDLEYLPERTTAELDVLVNGWVTRASDRLERAGVKDWTTSISGGKVVPDLIQSSRNASLLVVGAQGHGLVGGALMGSVSQHLARHALCDVVVVRAPRSESDRILVGVDGSDASAKALEFAFEHAKSVAGTVVAVHGRAVSAVRGTWDATIAPSVAAQVEIAERLLSQSIAELQQQYHEVPVELLAMPIPAVRALADASSVASLVVVGTRGRGGFVGLLLGSVSAGVLQHAQCPVAVIR